MEINTSFLRTSVWFIIILVDAYQFIFYKVVYHLQSRDSTNLTFCQRIHLGSDGPVAQTSNEDTVLLSLQSCEPGSLVRVTV